MKRAARTASGNVTRFQSFAPERVLRSQIKNAPYNPRTIDRHARAKLERSLKEDGLVESLVWNRRTGHLVGGHQRLSILDDLEGGQDYALDLAVIDVDEKHERQINVRLNNPAQQGQYDPDGIAALLKDSDFALTAEDMNFDPMDLQMAFASDPALSPLLDHPDDPPEIAETVAEGRAVAEQAARARAKEKAEREAAGETDAGEDDGEEPEGDGEPDAEQAAEIQRQKAEKKQWREARREADNPQFYLVLVCRDAGDHDRLMDQLGMERGLQYLDVAVLRRAFGLDTGGEEPVDDKPLRPPGVPLPERSDEHPDDVLDGDD